MRKIKTLECDFTQTMGSYKQRVAMAIEHLSGSGYDLDGVSDNWVHEDDYLKLKAECDKLKTKIDGYEGALLQTLGGRKVLGKYK